MAVSKALRFEIMRRDNHTCRYCGAAAPDAVLQIDHVVPTTLGGNDDPANLVTACRDCNSGKRATPPDAALVDDVAQDALRWAAAIKQAQQQALDEDIATAETLDAVGAVLYSVRVPSYRGGGTLFDHVPLDWDVSIEKFLAAGLTHNEIVRAARIAAGAKVYADKAFNYLCGVCWSMIRERQEAAQAIIRADEDTDEPLSQHDFDTWNNGYEAGQHAAEKGITGQDWYALGLYGHLSRVADGPR